MGEAAQIRDHVNGDLRKQLNFIIHSQDKNPDKYGENPYKDKPDEYDPNAQKVIDEARDRLKNETDY